MAHPRPTVKLLFAADAASTATFCPAEASIPIVSRLTQIGVAPELVARACRGDELAEAEIYAALAPATFGLIRRLVGGGAQAEDLFQETMMSFYERLPTFRAEAPLGAWVRQIALSKCFMYLRSPWHRARLQWDGAGDEWMRNAVDDPSLATCAPECLDVERALWRLPPIARAVIWLFEVEGYSHEEIGRAFGRTTSFSKSQLARAHQRLRAHLEPAVEPPACTSI
jgi:RNA polymerase sigma factor (sigma-70 family)